VDQLEDGITLATEARRLQSAAALCHFLPLEELRSVEEFMALTAGLSNQVYLARLELVVMVMPTWEVEVGVAIMEVGVVVLILEEQEAQAIAMIPLFA
jgi:hypothetical protein